MKRFFGGGFVLLGAALLGGCGGDEFGESVAVPQQGAQRISAAAGRTVRLPGDAGFNVADTMREATNAAAASSSADAGGTASCSVDTRHGGSGTAEFQLGHVITHDEAAPRDVTVTFHVKYACTIKGYDPFFGASPLRLKAFVADSQRRTLGRMLLARADPDRLPDRWTGTQSPSFDITLQPGLAYHLVVAGRVEVGGDGDKPGPHALIDIESLEIEVTPRAG